MFLLILGISSFVSSAYYVTDPTECPLTYQSQTCSGSDVVCGYSGGVTFCYDPANINPPNADSTTTGTGGSDLSCEDTTCSGGFVIDCYYYDGSAPHCDNGNTGFCDRNPTCYNKHVQTTCTKDVFVTSSCSATCTTNYFQCDGSTGDTDGCEIHAGDSCGSGTGTIVYNQCYSASAGNCTSSTKLDCDNSDSDGDPRTCNVGNGCEITIGGACSVGTLSGTYGSTCTGSAGTCQLTPQYFITSTNTQYQSNATNPFLWGTDFNMGVLLNLSWSIGGGFMVNASGAYFNNTLLGSGGVETDPYWTANFTLYNSSWSSTLNDSYQLKSNYTDWNASGWIINWSQVISTGEGVDLATLLGFGYWNNTFATFNKTYADTLYCSISEPLWTANFTAYNSSWSSITNTSYSLVSEPLWTDNFTKYNNSWTSTLNTSYRTITNNTFTSTINVSGALNMTGNISQNQGSFHCLNQGCTQWIMANSSGVYIYGG